MASTILRHILVDRARERLAAKRGGGAECVSLRWASSEARFTDPRLLDLDAALERLRREHARHAEVVVLRCFGGLALEEIGEALGTSLSTVKRDWTFATAWPMRCGRTHEPRKRHRTLRGDRSFRAGTALRRTGRERYGAARGGAARARPGRAGAGTASGDPA